MHIPEVSAVAKINRKLKSSLGKLLKGKLN